MDNVLYHKSYFDRVARLFALRSKVLTEEPTYCSRNLLTISCEKAVPQNNKREMTCTLERDRLTKGGAEDISLVHSDRAALVSALGRLFNINDTFDLTIYPKRRLTEIIHVLSHSIRIAHSTRRMIPQWALPQFCKYLRVVYTENLV